MKEVELVMRTENKGPKLLGILHLDTKVIWEVARMTKGREKMINE